MWYLLGSSEQENSKVLLKILSTWSPWFYILIAKVETESIIRSLPMNKSLGPNSFPAKFYGKTTGEIILILKLFKAIKGIPPEYHHLNPKTRQESTNWTIGQGYIRYSLVAMGWIWVERTPEAGSLNWCPQVCGGEVVFWVARISPRDELEADLFDA